MFPTERKPVDPQILSPEGRIAVVGVGGFGRFCLEAYGRTGDINVVSAADPQLVGSSLPSYPRVTVEADWRTVVSDTSVEVIHLATPPSLRGELAVPALHAGKSVFCEKPLALTLEEADTMLAASRKTERALGVDYVMRHHPAFAALKLLASSGLFGQLRTFSLQNFAQALPADHWMWDESKSGGILVEHGVHFFDAYGQIAGKPNRVYGTKPRKEAVQVTVEYAGGALGIYYHEFSFPQSTERTHAMVMFERGYVEIDGWIPERMYGTVMASPEMVRSVVDDLGVHISAQEKGNVTRFEIQFLDRRRAYQTAIVEGLRELVARHRDPNYAMQVSTQDARDSLALALAGRRACETRTVITLTEM